MSDGSASRAVSDGQTESPLSRDDGVRNPIPKYGVCVSLYGVLHRAVPRTTLSFGTLSALGFLVLVRQLYALAASARWSVLPAEAVAGAAVSCAFGLGYFAARDESSCETCDARFSVERVACRPVRRASESSEKGRIYVRETFECRECGDRTESTYALPDRQYPRH